MHVLVIEDSVRLRESIRLGLDRSGYAVDAAADGEAGLRYARHNDYDVILIDLMLPGIDGREVLRTLRAEGDETHVLVLTARGDVEDRVAGLRDGADDYLPKPFAFDELLARVEALVRRRYRSKDPVLRVGAVEIDTVARVASVAGAEVELTRREYALLAHLAYRRGQIIGRRELEDHLYDERDFPMSNAVERTICSLRKKLRAHGADGAIGTRRGLGYILDESAT